MPAPPSSAQKAANQKSMDAAKSRDAGMRGPVGSNAPGKSSGPQGSQSNSRDGGMRGPVGANAPRGGLPGNQSGPDGGRGGSPQNNTANLGLSRLPNSMPGNSNMGLNYGIGTRDNIVAALNNRAPMLGNQNPNIQYGPGSRMGVPAGEKVTDVFGPSVRMDPGIIARMNPPSSGVPAGQKVTDVFSQPVALDPSIRGRVEKKPTPPTVARLNPDGTLTMIKDQSRLAGYAAPTPANSISYPSEEGQIYSPASLANYVTPPKEFTDRIPQEPDLDAQRASIVNQWRQAQRVNNNIHRPGAPPSGPTAVASVSPTAYRDNQPVNINPPGQDAIDRADWANLQAMNDVGPQPPTNDLFGQRRTQPLGQGGQGNRRGLKNLPKAGKPTPVQGPTPPMPGFTWVQWAPGSPPSQIPTNALIGAA